MVSANGGGKVLFLNPGTLGGPAAPAQGVAGFHIEEGAFSRWLDGAAAGERFIYHVGDHAGTAACHAAKRAFLSGLALLFQRRVSRGSDDFEFIAIRCTRAAAKTLGGIV